MESNNFNKNKKIFSPGVFWVGEDLTKYQTQMTIDPIEKMILWWKRLEDGTVVIIDEARSENFKPIPTES